VVGTGHSGDNAPIPKQGDELGASSDSTPCVRDGLLSSSYNSILRIEAVQAL
jgi:hypothetical protein